jgi:hypothetical protein
MWLVSGESNLLLIFSPYNRDQDSEDNYQSSYCNDGFVSAIQEKW